MPADFRDDVFVEEEWEQEYFRRVIPSIAVHNYRCFDYDNPMILEFRDDVTALLGINNAGKSTCLRFFYEFRWLFMSFLDKRNLNMILEHQVTHTYRAQNLTDAQEIFCNRNEKEIYIELRFRYLNEISTSYLRPNRVGIVVPRDTMNNTVINFYIGDGPPLRFHKEKAAESASPIRALDDTRVADLSAIIQFMRILKESCYLGAFRSLQGASEAESYYGVNIGTALIRLWAELKQGTDRSSRRIANRVQGDISSVFGLDNLEINAALDGSELQLLMNGQPYDASEVGAGLIQIIISLITAAVYTPAFILIDEPELSLHPSLQLDFLASLASYARCGLIFATHSYGLARSFAERTLVVRRDDLVSSPNIQDIESSSRLSELLGELNFSSYKELGFEKVLLVEGPTEIKAIQQLLRKYKKAHQVLLLPLGGSSMIASDREYELNELGRCSSEVYALIDSERESEDDRISESRTAFAKACEAAGIMCHILKRRAFENYLSQKALERTFSGRVKSLKPYEKLKGSSCGHWPKRKNWLVARNTSLAELNNTDLGEFLDRL